MYVFGRDRSLCTATRYGLDGPGIESRRGRDFPHPFTFTVYRLIIKYFLYMHIRNCLLTQVALKLLIRLTLPWYWNMKITHPGFYVLLKMLAIYFIFMCN